MHIYRIGFGFLYGLVLVGFAIFLAGGGHGVYSPIGLISAPMCLISMNFAFLSPPFLWAFLAFCASRDSSFFRAFTAVTLVVLYFSATFVLLKPDGEFSDLRTLLSSTGSIRISWIVGLLIYLLGQIVFWALVAGVGRRPEKAD